MRLDGLISAFALGLLPGAAHADPATAFLTIGGLVATGTAAVVFKVAAVMYGLYAMNRQRKAAQNAALASLSDRTVQFPSTDMTRDVVYGERIVSGRWVYAVEVREKEAVIDDVTRPINDYFYVVLALAVDHEIESIEDLYFNGESVGPWSGRVPYVDPGAYGHTDPKYAAVMTVTSDSKYYATTLKYGETEGTIDAVGNLLVGVPVNKVLSVLMDYVPSGGSSDPASGAFMDPSVASINYGSQGERLGRLTFPIAYATRRVKVTYEYQENEPKVRAWFYRGTETQLVNRAVHEASGMAWSTHCRLRGVPYVVIEIKPDLDMFPAGIPHISARIKGKRCLSPSRPGREYSRNPAVHVYDYLRDYWKVPDARINLPLARAAVALCDEPVIYDYEDPTAAAPLPAPKYEPRYCNDIVLASDAFLRDNLATMLASMAGTCVYSGAQFDIRAGGAPEISSVSLDDSDLAGAVICQPELGMLDGFNCVRGRHVVSRVVPESEDKEGVLKVRTRIEQVTTDYPPYKSPTYISEDGGDESWQEIDLPGVASPYQAQRIAILQLRVGRNSLSFEADYKPIVSQLSAGQVVNINNETFGWVNKPFYLMSRERLESGNIRCKWTEAAPAIFEPNWSELTQPDPSPNTRLTPVTDVRALTGLMIFTGPNMAAVAPDGQVRPYASIEWNRSESAGVLYGGHIELKYRYGERRLWETAPLLAGGTDSHQIPILRGQQVEVEIRPMSGAQVYGPPTRASHIAANAPVGGLPGNLLANAAFSFDIVEDEFGGTSADVYGWSPAYRSDGEEDRVGIVPTFDGGGPLLPKMPGRVAAFGNVNQRIQRAYTHSNGIPVSAGQHMIGYASFVAFGSRRPYVGLRWFTSNSFIDVLGEPSFGNENQNQSRRSTFKQLIIRGEAPEGAQSVALILGFVDDASGNVGLVAWTEPMLAFALAGQITIPPWTK